MSRKSQRPRPTLDELRDALHIGEAVEPSHHRYWWTITDTTTRSRRSASSRRVTVSCAREPFNLVGWEGEVAELTVSEDGRVTGWAVRPSATYAVAARFLAAVAA